MALRQDSVLWSFTLKIKTKHCSLPHRIAVDYLNKLNLCYFFFCLILWDNYTKSDQITVSALMALILSARCFRAAPHEG